MQDIPANALDGQWTRPLPWCMTRKTYVTFSADYRAGNPTLATSSFLAQQWWEEGCLQVWTLRRPTYHTYSGLGEIKGDRERRLGLCYSQGVLLETWAARWKLRTRWCHGWWAWESGGVPKAFHVKQCKYNQITEYMLIAVTQGKHSNVRISDM